VSPASTLARTSGAGPACLPGGYALGAVSTQAVGGRAAFSRGTAEHGTAKPRFSASALRHDTMPMASPRLFKTGPPLAPGEIGQEIW